MSEIPMGGPGIPLAPDAPGGPGAPGSPPGAADEILVAFAEPAEQRRLTVLVRIILAIPHAIVLYVLGIASDVVALICWFAALFTGRLPDGLAGFQVGYVRWLTRFYAYVLLLTDVYPPFELADAQYPVRLQAQPGPLNRLAVLFRIILVIPALIVVTVLTYGLSFPVMFVTWLIVLIAGRMPRPLHEALAAALRYQARVIGYFLMLTARYPGGLFGDPAAFGAGPADSVPAGSAGPGTTGVTGVTEAPGAASAGPWGAWGSAAPEGRDPGQPAPDQPGSGPAAPGYGQPDAWLRAARAWLRPARPWLRPARAGLRRGRAGPARLCGRRIRAVRADRRPGPLARRRPALAAGAVPYGQAADRPVPRAGRDLHGGLHRAERGGRLEFG